MPRRKPPGIGRYPLFADEVRALDAAGLWPAKPPAKAEDVEWGAARYGDRLTDKPYRPSNGTEGDSWESTWCAHCRKHRKGMCPILLNMHALDEDDEKYPRQVRRLEDGSGVCLAYRPRKSARPADEPETGCC